MADIGGDAAKPALTLFEIPKAGDWCASRSNLINPAKRSKYSLEPGQGNRSMFPVINPTSGVALNGQRWGGHPCMVHDPETVSESESHGMSSPSLGRSLDHACTST